MAHAKKCDICGKYEPHDQEDERPRGWALVEMTQADPKENNRESIWETDLCPDCAVRVHLLLANTDFPKP